MNLKRVGMAVVRYGLLAGILGYGVWYVHAHFGEFAEKAVFTPLNIGVLVGLNMLTLLIESVRYHVQIRKIGPSLGIARAFTIFAPVQALNHLLTKAGTLSGGVYLNRKYGVSMHHYISFVITYVVVIMLGSGVGGLIAAVGATLMGVSVPGLVFAFFSGVVVASLSFIGLASLPIPFGWLPHIVERIMNAWKEIYTDYKMVLVLVGIEVGYFTVCTLRFMMAVSLFSGHVTFLNAGVILTVGNFLRIATIVPGGMGVAEVASGWIAGALGYDAALSGLAAGLDRLVYVIIIMISGGVGLLFLSGRSEFHRPAESELEQEMV